MVFKPKEQKLIKIQAPFLDQISGLAITKLLDKLTQSIIIFAGQIYAKYSNVRYDK